jgi:hypothetical protein
MPSIENISLFLQSAKPTDVLRKALVRHVPFSGQLLEHSLILAGLPPSAQVKDAGANEEGALVLSKALEIADELLKDVTENPSKGYITFKKIEQSDGTKTEIYEVSFALSSSTALLGIQPRLIRSILTT